MQFQCEAVQNNLKRHSCISTWLHAGGHCNSKPYVWEDMSSSNKLKGLCLPPSTHYSKASHTPSQQFSPVLNAASTTSKQHDSCVTQCPQKKKKRDVATKAVICCWRPSQKDCPGAFVDDEIALIYSHCCKMAVDVSIWSWTRVLW